MTGVIVIDDQSQVSECDATAILGYESILPQSSYTGQNENSDFPLINALDYRDNTKYSPAISNGTVEIVFTQSSVQTINYFAFAIHNSQDANMNGKLEIDTGLGYETVVEFSQMVNNRPFLKYFGDKQSTRQRLTLNFTGQLFIGSINIGKAVVFPRAPSLGFQPGRTASNDKVEQFNTEGNNFIVGRRLSRGFNAKGVFRYVKFKGGIDDWYVDYMNHVLDSKTLYFKWNDSTDETIYGVQNPSTLTKPSYVTSFHSDINFDINGYAE